MLYSWIDSCTSVVHIIIHLQCVYNSGSVAATLIWYCTRSHQVSETCDKQVKEFHFLSLNSGILIPLDIMTKELVVFSAMKSCLKKNNFHYFTISPNSENL